MRRGLCEICRQVCCLFVAIGDSLLSLNMEVSSGA